MATYAGGLANIGILGVKDVGRVSFYDNKTSQEVLYIDYAQTFNISTTADKVTARGRGSDLVSWSLSKIMEATMECEVTSMEAQSAIYGTTATELNTTFYNREVFTITAQNQQITLREVPANNTTVRWHKVAKDKRTKISAITEVLATNLAEEATIQPAGKRKLTTTGSAVGDIVVVNYMTSKQALSFNIKALDDDNVNSYTMVIHAKGKTHVEGAYTPMQIVFKNVNLRANGELNLDAENPSPFSISIDILQDSNGNMAEWSLIPDYTVGTNTKVAYPLD